MKKMLYLIAGPNGSGKTTLAHELLSDEEGLAFLNADETAAKIGDSVGLAAGRIILKEIDRMLDSGKSFALESTISGNYHKRVLKEAKNKGYEVTLSFVFLDSSNLNIERIKNRVSLGGHNVPDEDVIRRFDKSIKNFWDIVDIVDSWKLYYNSGDDFELIAEGDGVKIYIYDDDLYERFKGGLKQ
ncbi:MAG: zeta toxin family protein [Chitinispirillales bacterium]|jgi:predicted ABC-type ATPase|nr:zeta toxin family protein [Chitinispirillales bacterium]